MKRALVAIGITFAAALILGGMDRRAAEITARHERAAAEKKADVTPEERVELTKHQLTLPLGCGTWHATRGAGQHWRVYATCSDLTQARQ